MSLNNTARQLYLLVNPTAPPRQATTAAPSRASGTGLLSAVIVSVMLWAGLIWLGSIALTAFNR